eukprot:scaffold199904_cov14-Tisochrysis_lutea.AAC.1
MPRLHWKVHLDTASGFGMQAGSLTVTEWCTRGDRPTYSRLQGAQSNDKDGMYILCQEGGLLLRHVGVVANYRALMNSLQKLAARLLN